MEETKKKVEALKELKEKLVCGAKEYLEKGLQNVDTHEMGEVTDMIKDLAEAEEKCWKACYYMKIVEAMKEEKEQEELMMKMGMLDGGEMEGPMGYSRGSRGGSRGGRRGYDNWRYSSGRFAPTGRGNYDPSGYTPMGEEMEPWMMAEGFEDPWAQMMGYSGGGRGGSSSGNSGGGRSGGSSGGSRGGNSGGSSGYSNGGQNGSSGGSSSGSGSSNGRMGYSGSQRGDRYERYNQARMGYHERKDASSKEHMDASAREYVVDMAEAVKEIWKDADPAMRKEIKNKFVALTGEMN